jgi:GT2 family glycosyltransferase
MAASEPHRPDRPAAISLRQSVKGAEGGRAPESLQQWPAVAIIVLNWNGWRETIRCLASVRRITYPDYQVIVVDNGSTDDSVQRIQEWAAGGIDDGYGTVQGRSSNSMLQVTYSEREARLGGLPRGEQALEQAAPARRLVVILNEANLGFAAGNNVGIRYALARRFPFVNLLNSDVVVESGYLTSLVGSLSPASQWSVVGPKILYTTRKDMIWYAGGRVQLWRARGRHVGFRERDGRHWRGIRETEYVPGCCLLAKSQVFAFVGLLDEDFFFGAEDIDLALRARRLGFRFAVNLDARVYHEGHLRWKDESPNLVYYFNKYRLLLLRKRGKPFQQWLGFCLYGLTRLPKLSLLSIRGQRDLVRRELGSIKDFLLGRYGDYDRCQASQRGATGTSSGSERMGVEPRRTT